MARNTLITEKRNAHIVLRFKQLKKKNPKWITFAIIEQIGNEFYLEPTTISKILKHTESVPCVNTIMRQKAALNGV